MKYMIMDTLLSNMKCSMWDTKLNELYDMFDVGYSMKWTIWNI